jgi:hypothetical protein
MLPLMMSIIALFCSLVLLIHGISMLGTLVAVRLTWLRFTETT